MMKVNELLFKERSTTFSQKVKKKKEKSGTNFHFILNKVLFIRTHKEAMLVAHTNLKYLISLLTCCYDNILAIQPTINP